MDVDVNNIKVVVRVRPLLPRERQDSGSDGEEHCPIVKIPDTRRTILFNRKTGTDKTYYFDECISSLDEDPNCIDNYQFYNRTGPRLLDHLFGGYNVCFLAYGQTSSGKTYSMMGENQNPGVIPLLIRNIFDQMEVLVSQKINCELKFSYIEIYNEQVNDLLNKETDVKCKVREHPQTGPYVENVKEHIVVEYTQFIKLLEFGSNKRKTASTLMNDVSSRSHAVITLTLKQTKFESQNNGDFGDASEEMVSSIKLVDLAGSERMKKTQIYGQTERVKEGTLINKSLTVLGRCIYALATTKPKSSIVVPYRDSVLTYILKENLAGNSKTCMLFCVSPLDYEETSQTLNYANEVKKITTSAIANKTKLSTVPINWEELQHSEQNIVCALKKDIDKLTQKLANLELEKHAKSNSQQDPPQKFERLLEYLDRRSSKLEFENKYLKSVLAEKNNHILELSKHIDYLHRDYENLYLSYKRSQMFNVEKSRLQLMKEVETCCKSINKDLDLFDPSRF